MDKGVVLIRRIASDCVNPVITERYFEITKYFKDQMASEDDIVYAYVVKKTATISPIPLRTRYLGT